MNHVDDTQITLNQFWTILRDNGRMYTDGYTLEYSWGDCFLHTPLDSSDRYAARGLYALRLFRELAEGVYHFVPVFDRGPDDIETASLFENDGPRWGSTIDVDAMAVYGSSFRESSYEYFHQYNSAMMEYGDIYA